MPTFDDSYDDEIESRDGKRLSKTGRKLIKQWRADSFRCVHCGADVPQVVLGSQNRNHCPLCLWSRHVDESIGDRRATCLGAMRPLGFTQKTDGEVMVVHRCEGCGKFSKNRLAGDDLLITIEKIFVESLKHSAELEAETGFSICKNWEEVNQALIGG